MPSCTFGDIVCFRKAGLSLLGARQAARGEVVTNANDRLRIAAVLQEFVRRPLGVSSYSVSGIRTLESR